MNTNILQTLLSKSPPTTLLTPSKPSTTPTTQPQHLLKFTYFRQSTRTSPINSTSGSSSSSSSNSRSSDGNEAPPQPVPPTITPPNTVEVQFRRRSRRQKQKREEAAGNNRQSLKVQASATSSTNPTKNWANMSLTEKAVELYMGEKGMLFWLNKAAYASIFIMIGAWILFRFVGPALNLYQLDSAPLSPEYGTGPEHISISSGSVVHHRSIVNEH